VVVGFWVGVDVGVWEGEGRVLGEEVVVGEGVALGAVVESGLVLVPVVLKKIVYSKVKYLGSCALWFKP
jgi:hypothetical protein